LRIQGGKKKMSLMPKMPKMPNIPDEFNFGTFLLDRHLQEGRGEKVAVIYKDKRYNYRQIAETANRVGNALRELGVEQENRVMICLPDSPAVIFSYFGAMRIGAVPVPVSTMATPQDCCYYLNDSRAKVLITNGELAPKFEEVRQDLKYLRHFIVVDTPAEGRTGECQAAENRADGRISFEAMLGVASASLEPVATSKDDMAFWLYSSGTTGKPKGVVHLHHDLLYLLPAYCEALSIGEDDIIFSLSKMYFSYGNNNSLTIPFYCGATVILEPELPKPEVLFAVLTEHRPTVFYGVPTAYLAMLNYVDNATANYDLTSLRICMSSGEAMPRAIFDRWKALFGVEILEQLGSTDVGSAYMATLPGKLKPGSCGTILPGSEARLLDEDGKEVAQGETGALWLKNDGTTPFYWNKHDQSKKSIQGEWFNTGDKFYQDEDGFYWFKGRADDMLKAGGIWLSPLEVEGILYEHPAVLECAVVGVPDQAELEKPVAFVVLKEGLDPSAALERTLQDFVRGRIAHYKSPRQVFFVRELPRTATGKVQRFKLKEMISQL